MLFNCRRKRYKDSQINTQVKMYVALKEQEQKATNLKIMNTFEEYKSFVANINMNKIKKDNLIEVSVYTVLVILLIFVIAYIIFLLPDGLKLGGNIKDYDGLVIPLLVSMITVAITAVSYLSRSFTIQQKYYSTLESILFKLIDLEKECTDDELICKIHQLIQVVSGKMYK